jgi:hypothetical protein
LVKRNHVKRPKALLEPDTAHLHSKESHCLAALTAIARETNQGIRE